MNQLMSAASQAPRRTCLHDGVSLEGRRSDALVCSERCKKRVKRRRERGLPPNFLSEGRRGLPLDYRVPAQDLIAEAFKTGYRRGKWDGMSLELGASAGGSTEAKIDDMISWLEAAKLDLEAGRKIG
jgi:hypothetical protein